MSQNNHLMTSGRQVLLQNRDGGGGEIKQKGHQSSKYLLEWQASGRELLICVIL